jgi:hypothetical protein
MLCYAEALGGGGPRVQVAELPLRPGELWCALPPKDGAPPPDGALSLVADMPDLFDAASPLAGLWIDEWVEIIPTAELTTGIAFNFDEPAAQAPQAILLAVPPDESATWDIAALEAIVLEALDLARLRAVDPEALEQHTDLGQLLPALCISLNLQNDTVSTDFRRVAAGHMSRSARLRPRR